MLGILIASALAQEVDLSYLPKANEKTQVEINTALDYRVHSEDREKTLKRDVTSSLRELYIQEVTSQNQDGPTGLTLDCTRSFFSRTADDGVGNVAANTHRHKQRLTVSRSDGAYKVMIGDAAGTALDGHVGRWLDFAALLPPTGRAARGDVWQPPMNKLSGLLIQTKPRSRVDKKEIEAEFAEAKVAGSISCTLASLDGDVATIGFTGTLTASSSEDETVTVKIESGELKFSTSAHGPVSLTIKGSISIERTVVEEEYRKDVMLTYRTKAGTIRIDSTKWESTIGFSPATE